MIFLFVHSRAMKVFFNFISAKTKELHGFL